jgi:hypothetical protein
MKLKEICLMVATVSVLCVIVQSALATSMMRVEPSYVNTPFGEDFTVNIRVDPAGNEVYSASYTLYFNNTILKAISWTQGEFLTRDGESSNVWTHEINNTLGKFEYAEGRMGTDVGVGGDPGNLTTITFQAIRNEGVSLLEMGDLAGGLLESTSGPIATDISNGTCEIEDIIEQTPTSTPTTPPTTTIITTPVQTPTTIPITPTPTATAIQTPTILSTPSPSPTTITSPSSPTAPTSPPKEKSEENNRLPGFRAAFAITGLLAVFILKRKNVRK